MKPLGNIKALTFDLDDTLWELKPTLLRAEEKTFSFICEAAPNFSQHFELFSLRDHKQRLIAERPDLRHQISELRRTVIASALLQIGYDKSNAEDIAESALDIFLDARNQVEFFEHALSSLNTLHQQYRLATITNGNADLKRIGIDHFFELHISAEKINCSKPSKKIFEHTLKELNLAPKEVVHIGDHIDNDIRAAKAVGMQTLWVNFSEETWPDENRPDGEIKNLQALQSAIQSLDKN